MYLFISRFGFKCGICLLIAPVPVYCFSIPFKSSENIQKKEVGQTDLFRITNPLHKTLNELAMKARKNTVISIFSKEVIH